MFYGFLCANPNVAKSCYHTACVQNRLDAAQWTSTSFQCSRVSFFHLRFFLFCRIEHHQTPPNPLPPQTTALLNLHSHVLLVNALCCKMSIFFLNWKYIYLHNIAARSYPSNRRKRIYEGLFWQLFLNFFIKNKLSFPMVFFKTLIPLWLLCSRC